MHLSFLLRLSLLLVCTPVASAFGYISNTRQHETPSATVLHSTANPFQPHDDTTLMEISRPYRRDVYSYDAWVEHRSRMRFTDSVREVLKESAVIRQLLPDYLLVTGVAVVICVYNALAVTGYEDLMGVHHAPVVVGPGPLLALPGAFFGVMTPFLSLLLGRYAGGLRRSFSFHPSSTPHSTISFHLCSLQNQYLL